MGFKFQFQINFLLTYLIETPIDSTNTFESSTNQQQQQPLQPQSSSNAQQSTKSHIFQINFYRSFFDLDSDVFYVKLQKALNPFSQANEGDDQRQYPHELYGFVWITGTLIFLMFVSSTGSNLLNQWLRGDDTSKPYSYDFSLLIKSISLFYGYNFIVPFLLWAITTYYNKFPHPIDLVKTVSIYGYTNVLWVPITIINLLIVFINSDILKWVFVGVFGAITGFSNLNKISPIVKKNCLILNESGKLYYIILGLLAVVHLSFTVVVKISFFS